MDSAKAYRAKFGLPSVSRSSPLFSNIRYWQGPMWVNMNWFIIRGLEAAGETEQAKKLTDQTLEAVRKNGMYEYFDPDTGKGHGARDFSWTAALVLDLLAQAKK
jgi:glycogen debranching enzyme